MPKNLMWRIVIYRKILNKRALISTFYLMCLLLKKKTKTTDILTLVLNMYIIVTYCMI